MSRNGDAAVDELLVKRKRGRPRKVPIAPDSALTDGVVAASQGRLSEEGADPGGLGSEDLSTREQRVPAPLSEDVVDAHGNGVIGILTPSKRRGRPKKAVTFGDDEQREIDSQLGFRDIPIERRRSKGSSGAPGHDHGSGPGATLEIRGRTGTTAGIGSDGELPAPKRGSGKRRKHPLPAASPHDQGTPEKRGGRPPKHVSVDVSSHEAGLRRSASSERHEINPVGRPDEDDGQYAIPRKRGRPRKYGLHLDEPHPGEDLAVEDEADEVDEVPPAQQDITNEDGTTNFGALFWRLQRDHALDGMVELIKTTVLEKLTAKRRMRPIGLDEEYRKVHQLVEQTVVAGEGNSMLVIGARGSGKTTVSIMAARWDGSDEGSSSRGHDFHVVRLNGFIHTDDKLALREIWRQLGREMDMEEDNAKAWSHILRDNYADTLSSLLALLSHPAELSGDDADRTAKSVVFVLDEFELFASHPRQTLLYNLFDIAQARKAPVAVLGVTARVNVVESLEKRVKSRFSHRYRLP
ncbi:MAG: hypothetical protein M1832_001247 [Thelocarpon impressellum]|nr:MAG: hypothetical protein M1832_001247 [Thelocarpon impressellum]